MVLDAAQNMKVAERLSEKFQCVPMIPGRSMPAIFGRISAIVPWILRETRDGGFCSD